MAVFNLTILGALHQGVFVGSSRETVLDWVPSDSLFAALVDTWSQLGLDAESRLAGFNLAGDPPFLLTSAFPRADAVRFYPAPPVLPLHNGLFPPGDKSARKVRWLSGGVLTELVQKRTPIDSKLIHNGSVWLTKVEYDLLLSKIEPDIEGDLILWKSQGVPHVTVDRGSNASNLHHTRRVLFAPGCGLWFAVSGQAEWIRQALPHLADSGLGGLRSTGHGAFTWSEAGENLPLALDGWGLTLSRYAPATEDEVFQGLQAQNSAYQLVTVGGWCTDDHNHPWRRQTVRLVAEGALLPAGIVHGKLVNVRPETVTPWHGPQEIYRYALAFCIPAGALVEAA